MRCSIITNCYAAPPAAHASQSALSDFPATGVILKKSNVVQKGLEIKELLRRPQDAVEHCRHNNLTERDLAAKKSPNSRWFHAFTMRFP
jgi:hypothetical protein